MLTNKIEKFICVTEDAYKILVSKETKDKFNGRSFIQIKMTDEEILKKMKNYTMNEEDKNTRIIKPLFDENDRIRDISVLISVSENGVVWNRN